MNREQAAKLLPIIQAFAEGKEIQFFNVTIPENGWVEDKDLFHFGANNLKYRIKAEKKTGWINLYPSGPYNQIYSTKEQANNSASFQQDNRIACIQITYEEGEGL